MPLFKTYVINKQEVKFSNVLPTKTLLFLQKKWEELLHLKALHIFPAKKILPQLILCVLKIFFFFSKKLTLLS